ncbi:type II toxin-antitoxin system PemK/MazF family toxin [Nibricoccus sp. IMCC34717]|uniref:type II toxin-antitoxin system PemK/MazF family toxin n=1 Tax=Nibricoccus sp. IMCC34717 TaxID=3034021 RepID=UPI003850284B
MNIEPQAGEVWLAELSMVEKNRPVLVLIGTADEQARALVVVAPLTSQIKGGQGEVSLGKPRWLPKPSAVNLLGLASFDKNRLYRRLGQLTNEQSEQVKTCLRELFRL